MKYKHGRKFSKNCIQALRFVSKVGVMTRETWYELFSHGTERWKRMQLQQLVKCRVFKFHTCDSVNDAVVIDEYGVKLVAEKKWAHVHSIPPQFILHDEIVARGVWKLEQLGLCQRWMTERELKTQNSKAFKLDVKEETVKYPDAVLRISGNQSNGIVALEYERMAKTNWRYKKVIQAYKETNEYKLILYVVESESIEKSIQRAIQLVGDRAVASKIGFMSIEDWKSNPHLAKVRTLNGARPLKELI